MIAPSPTARALARACSSALGVALAILLLLITPAPARARQVGPIYPDDSPAARDGLARAVQIAGAGNLTEAARVIQSILTDDGDRVIESQGDPDLFINVRARAHQILLSNPRLLEQYRAAEENAARDALAAGQEWTVERTRLLTASGLEAALRVAQQHMESGRFEAARMTLQQLEPHPDRAGNSRGAQDAAALALRLARYLPRDPVRAWAEARAVAAGLPGPAGKSPRAGEPIAPPPTVASVSPLRPLPSLDASAIQSHPLQSVWLSSEAEQEAADGARTPDRRVFRAQRESPEEPWTLPTVAGDTVYTNDGRSIGAWDRFTLQPLWRISPRSPDEEAEPAGAIGLQMPGMARGDRRLQSRGSAQGVEDADAVAVAGSLVVACTGLTQRDSRDGDARVHAIDASTGRPLWSTSPGQQDPALSQAFVRGPVVIDGDTVILSLRKPSSSRRVSGAYLAGLDLWTGALKWSRLLGSAGWIFQRGQRPGDIPVVHEGVIYASDDLGVVTAVRADDGRVLWLRRVRAEGFSRNELVPPWSGGGPVISGDSLIVISPARSEVLRLALADGAVLGSRPAPDLGDPSYLVRVGNSLACIALEQVVIAPLETFETAGLRKASLGRDVRTRGRAVAAMTAAGPRLIFPVAEGAAVIDPERPETVERVALENSGNLVAIGNHILVADRTRLHSYLAWDAAESLLHARMDADPADPRPALTFVELAYRAGRADQVAPAADRVIAAVRRAPEAPRSRAAGRSLYASLLSMVQATEDQWDIATEPGAPSVRAPGPPIADLAVLDAIIDRLGRLAESAPEHVQHLMALGRLRDAQALAGSGPASVEAGARAVEAYQQLLEDPDLAGATWQSPRAVMRADLEAGRRARDLVRRYGRVVYRAFDAQAAGELAPLSAAPSPDSDKLEGLARRYPAATASLEAWLLSASAHDRASRPLSGVSALSNGLAAAEWALSAGDPVKTQVGEFAGRLVRLLQQEDRPGAAAQLLERVTREHPGLRLTVRGIEFDGAIVSAELRRSLAGVDRRPRIGRTFSNDVQAIEGWALVRALWQGSRTHATEHVVMISPERREIALFGAQGSGPLVPLWTRPYRTQVPQLVAVDAQDVVLFWPSEEGGELECVHAVGGTTRWKTPQFAEMFPPGEYDPLYPSLINTPVEGPRRAHDLLLAIDEYTAVVCSRSGRMAGIDLQTGKTLWAHASVIAQVFDITLGPGTGAGVTQSTLVVGGGAERAGVPGEAPGVEPGVAAYDARTGRLLHLVKNLGGEVHWLRTGPGGEVLVGLDQRVISLNLQSGKAAWEIVDSSAKNTSTAWVFGDRLIVLDPSSGRRLWTVSVTTGARRPEVLEPGPGFDELTARAIALGDPRTAPVAFCSRRGVAVFDASSQLVGQDPWRGSPVEVLPPEPAEGVFVAVETTRSASESGPVVKVHVIESPSGRVLVSREVVMHDEPREIILLDGRILIGTEAVTLVLNVPAAR